MQSTIKLFGRRIKEIRKKNNITQEKLAEMLCLDNQTISRIETGNFFTSYENLERMSKILNVEIKDFFDFEHLKDKEDLKKDLIKEVEKMDTNALQKTKKFIKEFI